MNRMWSHSSVLVGGVFWSLSIIALWQSELLLAQAPTGGELRAFTDKQGRKLEAQVISVSTDRRMMKIAQPDGREFELEILKLSLDDQQYLKDWIATRSTQIDYRLEVAIEKTSAKSSDRHRDDFYRMTTEFPGFEIKVKNISRETLKAPVIEYFLLKKEVVRIYQDSDTQDWDFSKRSVGREMTEQIHDVLKLEDLVYNREQIATTQPLEIDRVLGDGNEVYGEDEVLGLILQVRDEFGNVVGVFRSLDSGVKNVDWESLASAVPAGNTTGSIATPSTNAPPTTRKLTAIPTTFQKGDFLDPGDSPQIDGRPFKVSAKVALDLAAPNGTIVAQGGKNSGFGLVVTDGDLQWWVRSATTPGQSDAESIKVVGSALPKGPFQVEAEYSAETMKIWIDGDLKAEGPSIGLLNTMPVEGLSVGFDEGMQSVGPAPPPNHFSGAIEELQIVVGD
ncbi:MAG: hypothetical protein KDN20_09930 [Verrucomicrobiae bacterium]|nr:hypothetical protein [Verrucomicrobiae bacterium]